MKLQFLLNIEWGFWLGVSLTLYMILNLFTVPSGFCHLFNLSQSSATMMFSKESRTAILSCKKLDGLQKLLISTFLLLSG